MLKTCWKDIEKTSLSDVEVTYIFNSKRKLKIPIFTDVENMYLYGCWKETTLLDIDNVFCMTLKSHSFSGLSESWKYYFTNLRICISWGSFDLHLSIRKAWCHVEFSFLDVMILWITFPSTTASLSMCQCQCVLMNPLQQIDWLFS